MIAEPAAATRPGFGSSDTTGRARRRDQRAYAFVLVCGLVATGAAAVHLDDRAGDTARLVLVAVLGAAAVGVVGGAVGLRLRTRPMAAQVAVVASTAVAACLAGVVLATRSMFVSAQDLRSLLVVLAASGTVAALAGLVLGARLGRASDAVAQLSTRLAVDGGAGAAEPLPAELAAVADQLTGTWAELGEARAREEAIEHARRELVAWISHDVQLPLAEIRAMAQALDEGSVDAATAARFHHALRLEAERLTQLVDDLVQLSRLQADAGELVPDPHVEPDRVFDLAFGADGAGLPPAHR